MKGEGNVLSLSLLCQLALSQPSGYFRCYRPQSLHLCGALFDFWCRFICRNDSLQLNSSSRGDKTSDSDSDLPLTQLKAKQEQQQQLKQRLNQVSTSPKRKKGKKDQEEPQKPVSAYALFFRDTQAVIKVGPRR